MILHNTCLRPTAITPGYPRAWTTVTPHCCTRFSKLSHTSKGAEKPVTVCGEMANDPGCALLLLGMGFDGLSISASAIPRVKWAIRSVPAARMQGLAEQALQLDRPELVHHLLEQVLQDARFNVCWVSHITEQDQDSTSYNSQAGTVPWISAASSRSPCRARGRTSLSASRGNTM